MTTRSVLFGRVSNSGALLWGSAERAVLQPDAGGRLVNQVIIASTTGAISAGSPFSRVPALAVSMTGGPEPVRWNGRPRVAGVVRQPARTEGKEGLPSRR